MRIERQFRGEFCGRREGPVLAADCHPDGPLPPSVFRTKGAIVASVIPRAWQYAEFNHSLTDFVPLLELQETQQSPMFRIEASDTSLTMCSHDGTAARFSSVGSKSRRQ